MPGSKFVYIWFAEYHSYLVLLLAKFFRKPSILIIGGFDAANDAELEYGAHRSQLRSWFIKKACDLADQLLPVTKFTRDELFRNTRKDYSDKSQVIYNGSNPETFFPADPHLRKEQVITICGASREEVIYRKGVDFFLEIAAVMPETLFVVVGLKEEALKFVKERKSENVRIIPWCTHDELRGHLQESKVICQFSRYEAFGLALIEGMLCECAGVGYDYGGTSEIIDDSTGYKIPQLAVVPGKKAIKKALQNQEVMGPAARKRVIESFSLNKRRKEILSLDIIQEHLD
jgi:glycosyltransferase involved in cell wall biosynthesis